jgi:tRNA(Arg) A34 adenosine deaminase TadA
MNEESFMRRAIALARDNREGPFGAVIVRDDKIIAEGWDQVASTSDSSAHAEIVAIRKACAVRGRTNLPDCDIFTNCEPCPMCLGAIYWAGLRSIYYSSTSADAAKVGFEDEFIYKEMSLLPDKRTIRAIRIVDEEADLVLSRWASKQGRKRY